MYVVILLLIAIGGTGIIHGTMGTGELTSIIVYALQIIGSLMMVTFVFLDHDHGKHLQLYFRSFRRSTRNAG